MLTVNVTTSSNEQSIFSAVLVRASDIGIAIQRPTGEAGDPHNDCLVQDALVYVMNDTGATVAKYDLRKCASGSPSN